jgi:hypothetical protein
MRFALIDTEKAVFSVRTMCRVLDVSQSGYFAWKGRRASQRQRDDMVYLAHIRAAFELSRGPTPARAFIGSWLMRVCPSGDDGRRVCFAITAWQHGRNTVSSEPRTACMPGRPSGK